MSIQFYTSEELIEELTKRNTFVGLIIKSTQEQKNYPSLHQNWDITFSKLTTKQVYELMNDITTHFQQLANK